MYSCVPLGCSHKNVLHLLNRFSSSTADRLNVLNCFRNEQNIGSHRLPFRDKACEKLV